MTDWCFAYSVSSKARYLKEKVCIPMAVFAANALKQQSHLVHFSLPEVI